MDDITLSIIKGCVDFYICRGRKDKKREKARDGSREKRESSNSRKKSSRDKEKMELKAKPMKVRRLML